MIRKGGKNDDPVEVPKYLGRDTWKEGGGRGEGGYPPRGS